LSIFADQEQITFVRDKLHFSDYFRHSQDSSLVDKMMPRWRPLIALQMIE